jgi:HSP20 family protein
MLYELSRTQGGLLPEISQLLRLMDTATAPSSIHADTSGAFPQIKTGVTPDSVEVYAIAAGVDPDSLDVTIANNILTISGERAAIKAEDNNTKVLLNEIDSGPFCRTITLLEDVDPTRVDANYSNGVLHISVQRKEEAKTRRISINTEQNS